MSANIPEKIQSFLDEHKQELSDKLYKDLSELNLEQFKTKQNNFYEVIYYTNTIHHFDKDVYGIFPKKRKQIVKLPEESYKAILELIEKGNTCIDCRDEFKILKEQVFVDDLWVTSENEHPCSDIDCDEHAQCCVNIRLINSILVSKIKKI